MAKKFSVSSIKPLISNLAQTSHYQVIFGGLPNQLLQYLSLRNVSSSFIAENAGLLCYSASLPTSSLGTKMVDGNYSGIQEKFATSRIYQDIILEFYVDSDYKSLLFLESWIEFISSGSHNNINGVSPAVRQNRDGYFVRMQYPDYYKSNATKIIKFDRNYKQEIQYSFFGLFPYDISSIPVSYNASEILKVSAYFKYDRYVAGRPLSINYYSGGVTSNPPPRDESSPPPSSVSRRLTPVRGASGVVFYDANADTRTTAEVNRRFYDSQGRPIIN